jgi:flagellar protein FliO/FliZ
MEFTDLLRYVAALLMVLALIGFAGLAVRRFGMPGVVRAGSLRRLAVVETLMIGPRQRLFLISRDGVEHLVMAGPEGSSIIETGITPPPAPEPST